MICGSRRGTASRSFGATVRGSIASASTRGGGAGSSVAGMTPTRYRFSTITDREGNRAKEDHSAYPSRGNTDGGVPAADGHYAVPPCQRREGASAKDQRDRARQAL